MSLSNLNIPVIETERLILRGPGAEEFEAHAAFIASERSRYVGGPQDRFQAWRGFMASIGHWVLRGYGFWTAELRETGQIAGRMGFLNNDGWPEPELGWHLYDGFEGKGLASEGVRAARSYGARHFGLNGVVSFIAPDNTRSITMAERLGAVNEGPGTLLGKICTNYRHPIEEVA